MSGQVSVSVSEIFKKIPGEDNEEEKGSDEGSKTLQTLHTQSRDFVSSPRTLTLTYGTVLTITFNKSMDTFQDPQG